MVRSAQQGRDRRVVSVRGAMLLRRVPAPVAGRAGDIDVSLTRTTGGDRLRRMMIALVLLLVSSHAQPSDAEDRHATQRARMVAEIAAMARDTGAATGRPIF